MIEKYFQSKYFHIPSQAHCSVFKIFITFFIFHYSHRACERTRTIVELRRKKMTLVVATYEHLNVEQNYYISADEKAQRKIWGKAEKWGRRERRKLSAIRKIFEFFILMSLYEATFKIQMPKWERKEKKSSARAKGTSWSINFHVHSRSVC